MPNFAEKQKIILLASLVAVLGLAALASTLFFKEKAPRNSLYQTSSPFSAIIQIEFGDGNKRAFESELGEIQFPLDVALEAAAKEGQFPLLLKDGRVENIDGVNGAWLIYKKGDLIKDPLGSITISGGDFYTLKQE